MPMADDYIQLFGRSIPVIYNRQMGANELMFITERSIALFRDGAITVVNRGTDMLTIKQADEQFPDRHDQRSQIGKTPHCVMRDHERCRLPKDCACDCHDDKRPNERGDNGVPS
jgi:hypothetical protein